MEVNYSGLLAAVQLWRRRWPGMVGVRSSNIGSAAGLTNLPFVPTYSASKAALHS